ncbi:MAG: molecular chaperone [Burkholderiales bacterium]|nr:molecular chaperone [Burkholderiales bacterium]
MNTFVRALALALVALAQQAQAAQFSITPVRIFMTPRDRAIAVTITNESAEEVVMQADLYLWKQKPDGTDDLTLTEDLILSPPILKLGPNARQVVRLARISATPTDRELTYRLIVREVPEAKPTERLTLQVALAFSLPIFITPPSAKRSLQCSAERATSDAVRVTCENSGRAYAQLRGIEVLDSKGTKVASRDQGAYILPSIKRVFDVKSVAGRIPAGPVKVQMMLDDGSMQGFDASLPE